jgi:uncharacterized protein (TIGR02145 family)
MSKIKTTLPLCMFVGILSAVFISTNTVFADNLDYSVNVQPSMTVTIPTTTVNLDIDPSTSTFDSEDVTVTVGTNNPTGYSLSMSSEETDLTLDGGTETISTLDTLEGGYTLDTFTTNRWGYKLPTTNYLPFATNIALDSNDAPVNARTSTVTFAAKADFTKPSGTYKLAINFTAVANYVPPTPVDYCVKNGVADANCMQKMVASNCTTTAKTVMDSRDGKQYKVQRLADGKCWLLDNLRLDPTEPQVQVNLSVNTTNASDQTLNYLKGIATRDPSTDASGNYATAGVSYWTSSYSYSAPLIAIKNASDTEGTGWNPNTTTTSYGSGSGEIGVYYNFCAASAGSYCYGNGTSEGTSSGDAGEDICPAGWRMPTGGADTVTTDGKGEYRALYTAYSSNATNFRNALSTPLSGYFDSGSARGQGSYGRFWSSTRSSGDYIYYLDVDSSGVSPQYLSGRSYGYSVRCLLR